MTTPYRKAAEVNEPTGEDGQSIMSPSYFAAIRRSAIVEAKERAAKSDSSFDVAKYWRTKVEPEMVRKASRPTLGAERVCLIELRPAVCNELVRFGRALGFDCSAGSEFTSFHLTIPQ